MESENGIAVHYITSKTKEERPRFVKVHLAPTAAAPKVFFKWFYVNTITGEKSGEMMGYAKLAE